MMQAKTTNLFYLFYTFLIIFFSSCSVNKLIDKTVAKHYQSASPLDSKEPTKVISSISENVSEISQTNSKTSKLLPLVLYWQWNYNHDCIVNPQVTINKFVQTLNSYANESLKSKLGSSARIELEVKKIPHQFTMLEKGHYIFLINLISWVNLSFEAKDMEMIIGYKVLNNTTELKNGQVKIAGMTNQKKINKFKKLEKSIEAYLNSFDEDITKEAKQAIDQIIKEI